jgi:hypothetical protein
LDDVQDIESRLKQSVRTLRAWHWMSRISENHREVIEILTAEARDLIALGKHFPKHARQIGRLIVAYHTMIKQLKEGQHQAADDDQIAA